MAESTIADVHDRGLRTVQSASAKGSVFEMYGKPATENERRADEDAHPRSRRSMSSRGSPIPVQRRPSEVRHRTKVTRCGQNSHGHRNASKPGTIATGIPMAFQRSDDCVL